MGVTFVFFAGIIAGHFGLSVNPEMLAILQNFGLIFGFDQILKVYLDHQVSVITGRVNFDLAKALKEEHLNEGYKIAIDHIDEVISIIRSSPDTGAARENLRVRFDLSEEQAQAIVNMTLGRLSGMERQKVETRLAELREAIAGYRAILADPKILILDEATSAVDTETELAIQKSLEQLEKGRTVLSIAHRLSTLRNATHLIVLDNGRVTESGTHEELMALKGTFYKLSELQTKALAMRGVE